jgi:hypothetical protein
MPADSAFDPNAEANKIAYDENGRGDPVLLISGFPQTRRSWDKLVPLPSCARRAAPRFTARRSRGVRADRRELLKLLKAVGPGDVVTVTRIDRSNFSRMPCCRPMKRPSACAPRRHDGTPAGG